MENLIIFAEKGQVNKYLNTIKTALDSLEFSDCSKFIDTIYQIELKFEFYKQDKYKEKYSQFYEYFCNKVFLKLVAAGQFNFDLFKIAHLLIASNNFPPNNTILFNLETQLLESLKQPNEPMSRFVLSCMMFHL
ncbi:hypothetical protein BVY03_05035, partial [bacterium K02(2017)]